MTCKCGRPAEWLDKYCQACWEVLSDAQWWENIATICAAQLAAIATKDSGK